MIAKHLVKNTLFRYVVTGGLSYCIELSCLYAIVFTAHTSDTAAAAIAFWIGLGVSFLLQKLFAFSDRKKSIRHLSRQTFFYAGLVVFNYAFTIGFIFLFRHYDIAITRTIALLITTAWNYFVYRHVIFK